MRVFKVKVPKQGGDMMDAADPFYGYVHGEGNMSDYTLCGVASEEYEEAGTRKRITCPDCLDLIEHVRSYLANREL